METMQTRPLGGTSLTVGVVGMGTWQTYDVPEAAAVQPVTDAALDRGLTFVDTSPMYGAAERILAQTLGRRRPGVVVATKVWAPTLREGREQIRRALEWYGGRIELYQIHNLVAWQEHLPYLEELRAQEKVRAIGITHYSAAALDEMARLVEMGRVQTIQIPYSPVSREAEARLLPLAAQRGLGIIAMSPLERGRLARKTPPARELGFLGDYGLATWAQALLNWGLSDPRLSVTIPATGSVPHAVDNCAVGRAGRFDAAARERVARLAARC
jgi:aryl-alcohol dehydrogenase-like predicted oxidoreductase